MEPLNDIITNWYPVRWLASGGIVLTVWAWASKRKACLDIDQTTKLILERQYRNGQISKTEFERRSAT